MNLRITKRGTGLLAVALFFILSAGYAQPTASLTASSTQLASEGGTVTFTATIAYSGLTPAALGWTVVLPADWSHVTTGGTNPPGVVPSLGQTDTLEWAYFAFPPNQAQFTFTVSYPPGQAGSPTVTASAEYRSPQQTLAVVPITFEIEVLLPPTITQQPSVVSIEALTPASFAVAASGQPTTFAYAWQRRPASGDDWTPLSNGGVISGADSANLIIDPASAAMSGEQFRCVVSNGVPPAAVSEPATLTVARRTAGVMLANLVQLFDGSPKAVTVLTDPGGLAVSVTYNGAGEPPTELGGYAVVATVNDPNYEGAASGTLLIKPIVIETPTPSPASGTPLRITSALSTAGAASYQWQMRSPALPQAERKSGALQSLADAEWIDLPGATDPELVIPTAQQFNSGEYRLKAVVGETEVYSEPITIAVEASPLSDARLLNLSTRGLTLSGSDVLIPGLVIQGSANKRLLVRAVGPKLADFGVADSLPNPRMQVKRETEQGTLDVAANDDWGTNPDADEIAQVTTGLGAFDLDVGSKDAALLLDLVPGAYSVVCDDAGGATGVAIVEVYDADASPGGSRLVNISNRGFVGTGDNVMIPGFVVSEEGAKNLLIRAVGPTLEQFFVSGVLADPRLDIFRAESDGSQTKILSNNDWGENGDATQIESIAAQVGAFELLPGSTDAAFVVTLQPGVYTIQASGVASAGSGQADGGTGVALVEIYEVP